MNGKAGACVPETMRFNGNGYYNGGGPGGRRCGLSHRRAPSGGFTVTRC